AGWTLAYLMHVQFDRILDAFDGPFEKLNYGELILPTPVTVSSASVYSLSSKVNDSYKAVNALMKKGVDVFRNTENGDFYIRSSTTADALIQDIAKEQGIPVQTNQAFPKK